MSEYKELPDPPGGSITCADGQFPVVESDEEGRIFASCHNIISPGGGGDDPFGRMVKQDVGDVGAEHQYNIPELDQLNMLDIGNHRLSKHQLDKAMQIVTGVEEKYGGLSLDRAKKVAAQEYYEKQNGRKVWFTFPHHQSENLDAESLKKLKERLPFLEK